MKDSDTCAFASELPEVNPDGTLSDMTLGHVWARRRGNVSMLYPGVLEGSAHLPARLLLYFDELTRATKIGLAKNDASFIAWMSVFPAFFAAVIMLKTFRVDVSSAVLVGLGGVAGPVLYILWRAYFKRWDFYERTEWLDFTDRHWHSRKHFAQERQPAQSERVPFDELALVCFYRNWEQGGEYEIAICKLSECLMRNSGMNCPRFLNLIYSNEVSAEAFDCLSVLSARWGIACYSWDDGAGCGRESSGAGGGISRGGAGQR